jgi:hypothetical protein
MEKQGVVERSGVAARGWYMSWQRRGEKRYYYRNTWRNGRSVRTYVGCGESAELAATADTLRRIEQVMNVRNWRQEQERRTAVEALLNELCRQSDLLVRAALVVAGFHQHNHGAWRRRRECKHANRED